MDAIPLDVALKLCAGVREAHRNKLFSAARWQCWGCVKFSKGVREKMCGSVVGCNLVASQHKKQAQTEAGGQA